MRLRRMLTVLLTTIVGFGGCSKEAKDMGESHPPVLEGRDRPLEVGGIYASPEEDGSWRIVRVLALDEHAAHLRSYTDRFSEPPRDVALAKLEYFVGHIPVDRTGFENEPRILIKVVPVSEEELVGYRYYLEAMSDASTDR